MARTNIRVTGLIIKNGKILLFHRFREGKEYWTIPGGGVEDEESLEQALRREIFEETSLNITSFQPAFDFHQPVLEKLCHFFVCQALGEPTIGDGPEKDNSSATNQYVLEWVNINNLPDLDLYPSAAQEILKFYENIA